MKKRFLLLACVIVFQCQCVANTSSDGRIHLIVSIYDPTEGNVPAPSSEPAAPEVTQQGHTLSFGSHANCTLQLLSSDGTVAFETYIPSSVYNICLPKSLSGEYELRLYTDVCIYDGYIDL